MQQFLFCKTAISYGQSNICAVTFLIHKLCESWWSFYRNEPKQNSSENHSIWVRKHGAWAGISGAWETSVLWAVTMIYAQTSIVLWMYVVWSYDKDWWLDNHDIWLTITYRNEEIWYRIWSPNQRNNPWNIRQNHDGCSENMSTSAWATILGIGEDGHAA